VICSVKSEAPEATAVPSVVTVELSVFETTSNEPTVVLNSEPSVTWTLEPLTSTRSSAVVVSPVTFKLTLHFQSARPPQPAALLAGATVTTDGGSASSPSGSDGQLVVTLGQGKHTLQLDANDHFSTTQALDLQSDQELTVQLNRKAVVGTRLRSCAWVNGTQDKLPMFKSTLASGHCDTVIWQLFFVNGKGPDGYSRRGKAPAASAAPATTLSGHRTTARPTSVAASTRAIAGASL